MALDGIFLMHIAEEIQATAKGAKVNQVQEPSGDEIVLTLHTQNGNRKLLISVRADSPRISYTEHPYENPESAPMFCMLLRKHLCASRLTGVRQYDTERLVFLDFDTVNAIGDKAKMTLAVEIMGKHSNLILIDSGGVIIDALKRVDMTLSSKRMVLPALKYELPPSQNKLSLLSCDVEVLTDMILTKTGSTLSKAMLEVIMGVSPIVCRETAFRVSTDTDSRVGELSDVQKESLKAELVKLKALAEERSGKPVMLRDSAGKPFDFSFTDVTQYGKMAVKESFESFSELLDEYYHQRDCIGRMRMRSRDLTKLVTNNISRLSKKINAQLEELKNSEKREELRIRGDLLQANLYRIEKGASFADVENFYDENCGTLRIQLDPSKSPSQNAQRYYKDYARAKTAHKVLGVQIENARQELVYLESVLYEIESAESERELSAVRQELSESGYIKAQRSKSKSRKEQGYRVFTVSDGFTVLVGRNNRQNDRLTLKESRKSDIWLHSKDIPGSHTVIVSDGRAVTDKAIEEAAEICAWFSSARESHKVPVDYTEIRYVSKPQGSPPGRVIYTHQHTLYITPKEPQKE